MIINIYYLMIDEDLGQASESLRTQNGFQLQGIYLVKESKVAYARGKSRVKISTDVIQNKYYVVSICLTDVSRYNIDCSR